MRGDAQRDPTPSRVKLVRARGRHALQRLRPCWTADISAVGFDTTEVCDSWGAGLSLAAKVDAASGDVRSNASRGCAPQHLPACGALPARVRRTRVRERHNSCGENRSETFNKQLLRNIVRWRLPVSGAPGLNLRPTQSRTNSPPNPVYKSPFEHKNQYIITFCENST